MQFISEFYIAIKTAIEAGAAILEVYEGQDFGVSIKADHTPVTRADMISHQLISTALKATNIPVISEEDPPEHQTQIKQSDKYWLIDPLDGTHEFISRNGEFTVNIALVIKKQPIFGLIYIPCTKSLYAGKKGQGAYLWNAIAPDKVPSIEFLKSTCNKLPVITENQSLTVVASKSHLSGATKEFIKNLDETFHPVKLIQAGSSLKFCKVATGEADIYPRMDTIMEWDSAAGQAIIEAAGGCIRKWPEGTPLMCDNDEFRNPKFLAVAPGRDCERFF